MLAGRIEIPPGTDAEALAEFIADRLADEAPDELQVFGDRIYLEGGWQARWGRLPLANFVDRAKVRVDARRRVVRYRLHIRRRVTILLLLPLLILLLPALTASPWALLTYPFFLVWFGVPFVFLLRNLTYVLRRSVYLGLKSQGIDPHTVPTRGVPEI